MTTITVPTKTATAPMAGTQKPATTRPTATNHGATILKTTLVAGGIVATLLGANLAARQDQLAATTPVNTAAYTADTQVAMPQSLATLPNLSATTEVGTAAINALLNMPLAPIPSIAIPSVTSSRSSR